MQKKFILPTVGLIILYVMSNYYIGLRLWQSIGTLAASGIVSYYWIVFSFVAGSYFLGRLGAIYFPSDYSDRAIWYGSHWLGLAFYLLLFWLLYDAVILAGRFGGVFLQEGNPYSPGAGAAILAAAIAITIYGVRNAGIPRVRQYDITINKQAGSCKELHVVMISDLHLGLLVGSKRLMQGIHIINELDPDIVLMPGDILDENVGAFVENGMPEMLRGIQSRLGVFGVLGSHEYIYGHSEKALTYLKQAGITILRDQYIKLPNDIYLVGRDDSFKKDLIGTPRQTLETILRGCSRDLPIILMDHQPDNLEEAQLQGIDLQLSGHTHHGQMFPMGLLTQAYFEIDWGYLRKKQYQIIVSCGYGTWVAPLRVGTISEIVDITIKFAPGDSR